MKVLLATAIAAILSLFGIHQTPSHATHTSPSAQVASAVTAVKDPFHPASNDPGTTTSRNASSDSATSPQVPIIKQPARLNDVSRSGGYITQPVYPEPVERVVERIIQSQPFATGRVLGASTDSATLAKLADLQNQINALARAPQQVFVPSFSGPAASTPVSTATFAQSQKIDHLSNITVDGVSGLTASDIPALSYLPISGGSGSVSGDLSIGGNSTTTGTAYFGGKVGIGTSSPTDTLSVNGPIFISDQAPAVTTNRLYSNAGSLYWAGNLLAVTTPGNWTSDGTSVWRVGGNVGIANISPSYKLDVTGLGHFTGLVDAANFVATSSSVASIFNGGFLALASSTIGNGAQAGGLTISGGATTTGIAYFESSVGVGTTSPFTTFGVTGTGYFTGGLGVGVVNTSAGSILTSSSITSQAAGATVRAYDGTNYSQLQMEGGNGALEMHGGNPFIDLGAVGTDYDFRYQEFIREQLPRIVRFDDRIAVYPQRKRKRRSRHHDAGRQILRQWRRLVHRQSLRKCSRDRRDYRPFAWRLGR